MGFLCNMIRKGITSSIAVQSIRRLQTSQSLFAGHAKWQNIKHIKAAKDSQRSLMVAKQMRIIRMAITGRRPSGIQLSFILTGSRFCV